MAQPHKGNRHPLKLELDKPVRLGIAAEATDFGLKVSQYVADRLALHVGLPELVRELGQGTLTSITTDSDPNSRLDPDARYTMVRCDQRVYERIQSRASELGQTPVIYVEKFCTELVGGDTMAQTYGYQEVLAATG